MDFDESSASEGQSLASIGNATENTYASMGSTRFRPTGPPPPSTYSLEGGAPVSRVEDFTSPSSNALVFEMDVEEEGVSSLVGRPATDTRAPAANTSARMDLHHHVVARGEAEEVDGARPEVRHGLFERRAGLPAVEGATWSTLEASPPAGDAEASASWSSVSSTAGAIDGIAPVARRADDDAATALGSRRESSSSSSSSRAGAGEAAGDLAAVRGEEAIAIEESVVWNRLLRSMEILDDTHVSAMYVSGLAGSAAREAQEEEEEDRERDEEEDRPLAMLKILSFFSQDGPSSRRRERPIIQQQLQALAARMERTQRRLEDAGLMRHADVADRPGEVCRGLRRVHVDSAGRLLAEMDVEPCAVSLSDVVAFHAQILRPMEVVALLQSTVEMVAALHAAGVTHGALHGGNLLFSTDHGRGVLTQPAGLMSNTLYPSDVSFVSPRYARVIAPAVERVWATADASQPGRLGRSPPLDVAEKMALYTLAVLEWTPTVDTAPPPSDDLYALGTLTLLLLLGVPVFHGATLREVVRRMVPGEAPETEAAVDLVARFRAALRSPYATTRLEQAGYTTAFVRTAEQFVVDCLDAAAAAAGEAMPAGRYRHAGDLLGHPLLTDFLQGLETMEDHRARVEDTVHRVVYPVYTTMEHTRAHCGTTPYHARLHRNSIFAARGQALQASLRAPAGVPRLPASSRRVASLWPYLERRTGVWPVSLTTPREEAAEAAEAKAAPGEDPSPEADTEWLVLPRWRTVVWAHRRHEVLSVSGAERSRGGAAEADTLVLRDLEGCHVEILTSFRFVVLVNVRECELLLGPCFACYMLDVRDCTPLAVAASYLLMHTVSHVQLQYSGNLSPSAPEASVSDVCIEPYALSYPGLSADFALVGLPQEHRASLMGFEDGITISGEDSPVAPIHRCMTWMGTEGRAHDFPYAHALVGLGPRWMHSDDGDHDVYFFFRELHEREVYISAIHGGLGASPGTEPEANDGHAGSVDGGEGREHFPILFILDVVGDVVVDDCSYCTIFVVGSTGSVVMSRCHHVQAYIMARELVVEDCEEVEMHALVTAYAALLACRRLHLLPLFLDGPHVEAILERIVMAPGEEASEQAALLDAFARRDVVALNVVLHGTEGCLSLRECEEVTVYDAAWHRAAATSRRPVRIVVPSPPTAEVAPVPWWCDVSWALPEGPTSPPDWEDRSVAAAAARWAGEAAEAAAVVRLRLHDLVDASLFRLEGGLHLRETPLPTAAGPLPRAVDVVLERISFGEVHLAEAVRRLHIRDCRGPLDIIVCAAQEVQVENCENVVLRVACGTLVARDCHHCHLALHITHPPRYERCTSLWTSALNVTARDLGTRMEAAGLSLEENRFHTPHLETAPPLGEPAETAPSADALSDAFHRLRQPVTVVPPLAGICVALEEVPFLAPMDTLVAREARRPTIEEHLGLALDVLAREDWLLHATAVVSTAARAAPREGLERHGLEGRRLPPPPPSPPSNKPPRFVDPTMDAEAEASCSSGEAVAVETDGGASTPPPSRRLGPPPSPDGGASSTANLDEVCPSEPPDVLPGGSWSDASAEELTPALSAYRYTAASSGETDPAGSPRSLPMRSNSHTSADSAEGLTDAALEVFTEAPSQPLPPTSMAARPHSDTGTSTETPEALVPVAAGDDVNPHAAPPRRISSFTTFLYIPEENATPPEAAWWEAASEAAGQASPDGEGPIPEHGDAAARRPDRETLQELQRRTQRAREAYLGQKQQWGSDALLAERVEVALQTLRARRAARAAAAEVVSEGG